MIIIGHADNSGIRFCTIHCTDCLQLLRSALPDCLQRGSTLQGTVLQEDYINALTTVDGGVHFPLTVAEGCIFVLGDNRGISKDSRYPDVGQIDKREVLGKAIFLMYPGTDDGTYPREFERVGAIQ